MAIAFFPSLEDAEILEVILADISGLALPLGVQGMAGLRFLRHFRRWGAEQTKDGAWQFFLETAEA